jgi:hypothetical protein
MINRPGRFFYSLDYKGLDNEFIIDYCKVNLINASNTESVCKAGALFSKFNFDMLQAIVEEMNRYNETAAEVIKFLNAKPMSEGTSLCVVEAYRGQEKLKISTSTMNLNPTCSSFNILVIEDGAVEGEGSMLDLELGEVSKSLNIFGSSVGNGLKPKYDTNRVVVETLTITPFDMEKMDAAAGMFIYRKNGVVVNVTRQPTREYSYEHML